MSKDTEAMGAAFLTRVEGAINTERDDSKPCAVGLELERLSMNSWFLVWKASQLVRKRGGKQEIFSFSCLSVSLDLKWQNVRKEVKGLRMHVTDSGRFP